MKAYDIFLVIVIIILISVLGIIMFLIGFHSTENSISPSNNTINATKEDDNKLNNISASPNLVLSNLYSLKSNLNINLTKGSKLEQFISTVDTKYQGNEIIYNGDSIINGNGYQVGLLDINSLGDIIPFENVEYYIGIITNTDGLYFKQYQIMGLIKSGNASHSVIIGDYEPSKDGDSQTLFFQKNKNILNDTTFYN